MNVHKIAIKNQNKGGKTIEFTQGVKDPSHEGLAWVQVFGMTPRLANNKAV